MKGFTQALQPLFTSHYRRFIKFGTVGFINTGVDLGIFCALTYIAEISVLLANTLSYLTAVICSYFMNKVFTFRDRQHDHHELVALLRFITIGLIGLGLSNLIIWLTLGLLGPLLAKVFSIGLIMFWNYFASLHLVFSPKKTT